jgi:hypothetical protein
MGGSAVERCAVAQFPGGRCRSCGGEIGEARWCVLRFTISQTSKPLRTGSCAAAVPRLPGSKIRPGIFFPYSKQGSDAPSVRAGLALRLWRGKQVTSEAKAETLKN